MYRLFTFLKSGTKIEFSGLKMFMHETANVLTTRSKLPTWADANHFNRLEVFGGKGKWVAGVPKVGMEWETGWSLALVLHPSSLRQAA